MAYDPQGILLASALRQQNKGPSQNELRIKLGQQALANQVPTRGWGDALANIANSLAGGYAMHQGREGMATEQAAADEQSKQLYAQILAKKEEDPTLTFHTVKQGDEEVSGFFDPKGKLVTEVGRGRAYPPGKESTTAPPVKEVRVGDEVVAKQWNPETNEYDKEIGRGPAFAPPTQPAPKAAPTEETKAYEDTRNAALAAQGNLSQIRNLYGSMDTIDLLNPLNANRAKLQTLYADTWERLNKLNQNGVLNDADLEQAKKALPDPTSWKPSSPETVNAAIDQVNDIINRKLALGTERGERQGVRTAPPSEDSGAPAPAPSAAPPATAPRTAQTAPKSGDTYTAPDGSIRRRR